MKTWQRWAVGTSSVVLAMAAGTGIAFATIPDSGGVIHGCYKTPVPAHGTPLQVIDTDAGGSCPGGTLPLTWNQTGPQGPQGATGAQGPTGPAGSPGISGYQMITQTVGIGPSSSCSKNWTMDVPAGKMVLGAGIDRPGGEDGYIHWDNGPASGDPAKWEFEATDGTPNQGCGFDTAITSWITVATISS